MQYIGLQTQIWRNNFKSTLLMIGFPSLILGLLWVFYFFIYYDPDYQNLEIVNNSFFESIPMTVIIVGIWFLIAYFSHSSMISKATGARSLERKENMRIYNLVENLCISVGMKLPKINVIEDDSLNAFASGINENSYTVTLSRGIINKLDDEELKGVIAHELTHIRNKDVRLLIISIIFVGIFAFVSQIIMRSFVYGRRGNNKRDGRVMLIALAIASVGYLLSVLFRFALSRKREYLADAGAVEMTRNSLAFAHALEKVSQDSRIEAVERHDIAQLFIENPQEKKKSFFSFFSGLFATHPPIDDRIRVLKGM